MQLTYKSRTQETDNVWTFHFEPDKKLDFIAGQFIELTLIHDEPDSRGFKRWFTISSSPTNDQVSVTTRFAVNNGSSYKHALMALEPGDTAKGSQPMGDFVLPLQLSTPLIFVAGGIGITPFLSILRWLKDTGESRNITLLQSVSTEDDIAFQDVFESVGQHATLIVSRPTASWGGERGHLSAELITGLAKPSNDTLTYISGPEGLVESLVKDLQAQGIRKNQIIGDYFPNYPAEDLI